MYARDVKPSAEAEEESDGSQSTEVDEDEGVNLEQVKRDLRSLTQLINEAMGEFCGSPGTTSQFRTWLHLPKNNRLRDEVITFHQRFKELLNTREAEVAYVEMERGGGRAGTPVPGLPGLQRSLSGSSEAASSSATAAAAAALPAAGCVGSVRPVSYLAQHDAPRSVAEDKRRIDAFFEHYDADHTIARYLEGKMSFLKNLQTQWSLYRNQAQRVNHPTQSLSQNTPDEDSGSKEVPIEEVAVSAPAPSSRKKRSRSLLEAATATAAAAAAAAASGESRDDDDEVENDREQKEYGQPKAKRRFVKTSSVRREADDDSDDDDDAATLLVTRETLFSPAAKPPAQIIFDVIRAEFKSQLYRFRLLLDERFPERCETGDVCVWAPPSAPEPVVVKVFANSSKAQQSVITKISDVLMRSKLATCRLVKEEMLALHATNVQSHVAENFIKSRPRDLNDDKILKRLNFILRLFLQEYQHAFPLVLPEAVNASVQIPFLALRTRPGDLHSSIQYRFGRELMESSDQFDHFWNAFSSVLESHSLAESEVQTRPSGAVITISDINEEVVEACYRGHKEAIRDFIERYDMSLEEEAAAATSSSSSSSRLA